LSRIYKELKNLKHQKKKNNNPANRWANKFKRQFSKEVQMSNKDEKTMFNILSYQEKKIKTMRFHLSQSK
jgi:aromatic ring-opening dioxygenase catalytic subunit (LigB family)